MFLDSGEYVVISACVKVPYNSDRIVSLIDELDAFKIEYLQAEFLGIRPHQVTFDIIWEGDYKTIETHSLSREDLKKNLLGHINFMIMGLEARLQVNLLDDISYEVSLIFSYEEFQNGSKSAKIKNKNFELVEQLAIILFKVTKPIYGLVAIEKSVCGIKSIVNDECVLPSDKVFYSYDLIQNAKSILQPIINKAVYKKEIQHCGVYLRKTQIDNYNLIETEDEENGLRKLKNYFLKLI